MSELEDIGSTPFDRMASHMEHEDLVCSECGYDDEDGSWRARTTGGQVLYTHVCPSCGAIRKRTYHLDRD
ncbi:HVO_0649 family zinc finger protein [Halorussus caseinilyticus]|uniref:HVO_0649 family zinc finger protein n=1 Tax=Halorussus caseinilyticus TaxID=3034025 RepID=A0ABD5WQJ6_9EURY|nr:HVO_0649 family zinc finger protein [Halorussus sp. DT72]